MHLDLDAFFASVEQRDKPSLRGKPVVVGGTGGRGVVATASYEARSFGVRSAMSTREARALCPHAAYLSGRFAAYGEASRTVMDILRGISELVEPLSFDEAFVDLAAADLDDLSDDALRSFGERVRAQVADATGGLTASVGLASSKFMAKVASEMDKPDGLTLVVPGTEVDILAPMEVRALPGVGPVTGQRLRRMGVTTVGQLQQMSVEEVIALVGHAHGERLHLLAHGIDDRPVEPDREVKSVSVENTYEQDLVDRRVMEAVLVRQAGQVAERLAKQGLSGRTVQIKVRLHDFTTLTRSQTLAGPTDRGDVIATTARTLLRDLDPTGGVRLLGVGVAGLADWVQEELFETEQSRPHESAVELPDAPTRGSAWATGSDVEHVRHGAGWVWGSGRGFVTVRFETSLTGPGPVRTFAVDDPELSPLVAPTSED